MARNTVKVKNYLNVQEELVAAAAITPGMLVEFTSAGKVQAHSTAGGNAIPIAFALEDELQGNDIDTEYAAAAPVQVWIPQRGDMVNGILADGQEIVIGDALESAGDGTLQKHTADKESFESAEAGSITIYPNQIVGIATEAKNLSGSSGEESSGTGLGYNKRLIIRIV